MLHDKYTVKTAVKDSEAVRILHSLLSQRRRYERVGVSDAWALIVKD